MKNKLLIVIGCLVVSVPIGVFVKNKVNELSYHFNDSLEGMSFSEIEVVLDESSILTNSSLEIPLIRTHVEKHLRHAGAKLHIKGTPSLTLWVSVRYLDPKGEVTVGKEGRPVDMKIVARTSVSISAEGDGGIAYTDFSGMIDKTTGKLVQSLGKQFKAGF